MLKWWCHVRQGLWTLRGCDVTALPVPHLWAAQTYEYRSICSNDREENPSFMSVLVARACFRYGVPWFVSLTPYACTIFNQDWFVIIIWP
jgi:hypothetical protein